MGEKRVVMLNGKEIELPEPFTEEEMDDLFLIDEDSPTRDLNELLEDKQEIDWSKYE